MSAIGEALVETLQSVGGNEAATNNVTIPNRPRSIRGGTILRTISRMCGELQLDRSEARVGERVQIQWTIRCGTEEGEEPPVPSERDWIGMFRVDDLNPESFLDYRMRGQNLDDHGQVQWLISDCINEESGNVCFCFYTSNNVLLAQSDELIIRTSGETTPSDASINSYPLTIINEPIEIRVHGLSCSNLRVKTFGPPDPFLKLSIINGKGFPKLDHHGESDVTSTINQTSEPHWENEEFTFRAIPSDVLLIDVRDKFSLSRPSASHFMGRSYIALGALQHQQSLRKVDHPLQKRLPSDRVSGYISLTITSNLTDLPFETTRANVVSLLSPVEEIAESPPEDFHEIPPERPADRIRWVRRTLHGDQHRRRYSSNRHSSVIVQHSSRNSNFTSSLRVVDTQPTITNTDPLTESCVPTMAPQNSLHLGLEQFMARSSRNQLMRQNSCPAQRTSFRRHQGLEPVPLTQTETNSEFQTHTSPHSSTSSTPLSPVQIISEECVVDDVIFIETPDEKDGKNKAQTSAPTTSSSLAVPHVIQRIDSVDDSFKEHPGFLFLTRTDLYEYAKAVGNDVFFRDLALLKLIQSIRSDHTLFSKYVHSSRLVKAINSFALIDCELPDGWEKRVDKTNQKVVFVDHNSQSTTYIDPRLPLPGRQLRTNSVQQPGMMRTRPVYSSTSPRSSSNPEISPPTNRSRPGRSATTPTTATNDGNGTFSPPLAPPPPPPPTSGPPQTYSERIVAFLRQQDIFTVLSSRYENISNQVRRNIEQIRSEGVPKLEQLQNESDEEYFELTIILSLFEMEIEHQVFYNPPSSLVPPPLPPPVPSPSQPPVPTTPPDMDVDQNDYMGIAMYQIIDFFQSPDVYHTVLRRCGSIQPYMRQLIVQFSGSLTFEVAEVLSENAQARQFIFDLRNDILNISDTPETPSTTTTSTATSSGGIPTSSQVLAFMSQPNILDRLPSLDPDERSIVQICGTWDLPLIEFELNRQSVLRDLVERIAPQIIEFDNNHSTRVTPNVPTPPPPPPRLNQEFVQKLQQLQSILDINGYASSSYGNQRLSVRRENLLEDAYRFIMSTSAKHLRAQRIYVSWDEEEGLDYGGPQRELFFKLSRVLFNPYYGLFEYTAHGAYTVQISRYSSQIDDAHLWFRFAGRVIGYAIIQNHLLDVFFARHVYKSLLGLPFTVSDVEAIDISFYNSLKFVLENDPAPLELTFTVPEESFGEVIDKELKPGGAGIEVTENNKKEYVDLMVQWRLSHGVQQQVESMSKGLKEMIPLEYLRPFDAKELEWVIAGTPEINMEDWKANTQYWGGYSSIHQVILWFWEAIESFTDEQKLRFLQFATGTSSIPYEGFKALRGSSQQLQKFTIDRHTGLVESLVIAHTCFNRIDLPPYRSREEMREKLLFALTETDTFESA